MALARATKSGILKLAGVSGEMRANAGNGADPVQQRDFLAPRDQRKTLNGLLLVGTVRLLEGAAASGVHGVRTNLRATSARCVPNNLADSTPVSSWLTSSLVFQSVPPSMAGDLPPTGSMP